MYDLIIEQIYHSILNEHHHALESNRLTIEMDIGMGWK